MSAAVLAADVVRHPHTVRLADTLDRVLALSEAEASQMGEPAAVDVRARVLEACTSTPAAGQVLEGFAASLHEEGPSARLATRLESALIGSLLDVHALLLQEPPLLGLSPTAQQVALDAVTAAWAGASAQVADVRALSAAWEAALDPVPRPLPERPWTAAVRRLLEEVPQRSPEQWRAAVAHHRARRPLAWSDTLHVACAGAWQAGRLHDVARAQLAAARALALTHTGVPPYGAALVLTGAVQAECTADLVGEDVTNALRAAWDAGGEPR